MNQNPIHKWKCCLANVSGVKTSQRWAQMCNSIFEEDLDIAFITGTWLDESVPNEHLEGYDVFRCYCRSSGPARKPVEVGGVLCIARKTLELSQAVHISQYDLHSCDVLIIDHQDSKTRFFLIHRPSKTNAFESESLFEELIKSMKNGWNHVILGALNYQYNPKRWDDIFNNPESPNRESRSRLSHFFEHYKMEQMVYFCTTYSGYNTPDVIIGTRQNIDLVERKESNYLVDSSHNAILFEFKAGTNFVLKPDIRLRDVDQQNFAVIEKMDEKLVKTICKTKKIECPEIYPEDSENFPGIVFLEFSSNAQRNKFIKSFGRMLKSNQNTVGSVEEYSIWKERQE